MSSNYIAPIVYLYATGLLLLFGLLVMTLYRIWLPSWIRTFRHPRLLRWLAPWIVLGVYLMLVSYLWLLPLLSFIPLTPDPILHLPLGFWLLLLLWIISLVVVLKISLRPQYETR